MYIVNEPSLFKIKKKKKKKKKLAKAAGSVLF
jgi:hypothetical protein